MTSAMAESDEEWIVLDRDNPADSSDDDDVIALRATPGCSDDEESDGGYDDDLYDNLIEEEDSPRTPPPRPLSGLFLRTGSKEPAYLPFDPRRGARQLIPDPRLSAFKEKVTVLASTHGLLCVRGGKSDPYYVFNPLTFRRVRLPPHTRDHWTFGKPAVVVTFEVPNKGAHDIDHYHVVVAFPILRGVFAFESFSSRTWEWRVGPGICDAGEIMPSSGVGALGRAFWRATIGIVYYDPEKGCSEIFPAPKELEERKVWELGEMDGSLCVTCMDELATEVSVLYLHNLEPRDGESPWAWAGQFEGGEMRGKEGLKLLRSQGAAEVVMWDPLEERVVGMDLEGRTIRTIGPLTDEDYRADFIPYVASSARISSTTMGADFRTSAADANTPDLEGPAAQVI